MAKRGRKPKVAAAVKTPPEVPTVEQEQQDFAAQEQAVEKASKKKRPSRPFKNVPTADLRRGRNKNRLENIWKSYQDGDKDNAYSWQVADAQEITARDQTVVRIEESKGIVKVGDLVLVKEPMKNRIDDDERQRELNLRDMQGAKERMIEDLNRAGLPAQATHELEDANGRVVHTVEKIGDDPLRTRPTSMVMTKNPLGPQTLEEQLRR